jgi:hypothetical protein
MPIEKWENGAAFQESRTEQITHVCLPPTSLKHQEEKKTNTAHPSKANELCEYVIPGRHNCM